MNYKFLGWNHRAGTSAKSGKSFDFYEVNLASPFDKRFAANTVGYQAFKVLLSPEAFYSSGLSTASFGDDCTAVFDHEGKCISLTLIP